MASRYQALQQELRAAPRKWLVTGAAGFIGSHLAEQLLRLGQQVIGLDNFSTGSAANLEEVRRRAGTEGWRRFQFLEGDVCDLELCRRACRDAAAVLHHAALGSVPWSLDNPLQTNRSNVEGLLTVFQAARDAGGVRVVYASSSSVYGDCPEQPAREDRIGRPLSPYAASKQAGEAYAAAFGHSFGLPSIGLRYFNVLGPRQDPRGPYAAVVPRWIQELIQGRRPVIFGDGETSRDFCPVADVVQANLLAALAPAAAVGRAYNVALGRRTTLRELFFLIRDGLAALGVPCAAVQPEPGPARAGDIRHSLADVALARRQLSFEPETALPAGLRETLVWFLEQS